MDAKITVRIAVSDGSDDERARYVAAAKAYASQAIPLLPKNRLHQRFQGGARVQSDKLTVIGPVASPTSINCADATLMAPTTGDANTSLRQYVADALGLSIASMQRRFCDNTSVPTPRGPP